ncbi:hypothetical protein EW15_1413 [Prochlorococcus sp. MIT 0801]|nr:hypothetical protein EW15_1413 [Prochlorococcus sp. MIT 0801]
MFPVFSPSSLEFFEHQIFFNFRNLFFKKAVMEQKSKSLFQLNRMREKIQPVVLAQKKRG